MRLLVTAVSKHGSTTEIAHALAQALLEHDVEAAYMPPDDVVSLKGFDGAVLGSAVYAGHWMEEGKATRRASLRSAPGSAGLAVLERPDREPCQAPGRSPGRP